MFAVRESQLVEVALNLVDWSVVPIAVSEVTPVDSVVGSVVNPKPLPRFERVLGFSYLSKPAWFCIDMRFPTHVNRHYVRITYSKFI